MVKWVTALITGLLLVGILVFMALSGCVPAHTGWTRAEVHPNAEKQQAALDKDREACVAVETSKPAIYQFAMGGFEVESCLERKGWTRVK